MTLLLQSFSVSVYTLLYSNANGFGFVHVCINDAKIEQTSAPKSKVTHYVLNEKSDEKCCVVFTFEIVLH